jgi:electron transport complex protein RnfG
VSDSVKMVIKLFIITAVAALALGVTHAVTQEPIRQQNEQAAIESRKAVLPDGEQFNTVDISQYQNEYPGIVEVYEGRAGDTGVGYVFKIVSKGYGGDMELYVGISASEAKLTGITVVNHSETPGLGAKAADPEYLEQFIGKPVENPLNAVNGEPTKDEEVEAITGATITSKAIIEGINDAITLYNQVLKDGGEGR